MEALLEATETTHRPAPCRGRPRRWRAFGLFASLTVAYFAIGCLLVLRYNIYERDALSRTANAGYILFSRDPHLGAVGFVWNPLPSLVQTIMLPFYQWWPELLTRGLAGLIQSALFMAGCALIVRQIAIDRGVGDLWRRIAIACLALNPMIIISGENGMSEAAQLFCILWCVRYLLLWVDSQSVTQLGWAGLALGVGYLARYEMVIVGVACGAFVALVTFVHSARGVRLHAATLNLIIVSFPLAVAFVLWAVGGWVISGDLFATLSSQYGNTSQVEVGKAQRVITQYGDWFAVAEKLFSMQPFAGIAVIVAAALAALTKRVAILVPVVAFGAALAFQAWGQYNETTFGWFRFYLPAVPMVIVVALCCWTPGVAIVDTEWWPKSWTARLGSGLLTASLVVAIPVTGLATLDQHVNNTSHGAGIASLLKPGSHPHPEEQSYRRTNDEDRLVADYLDRQNLPDGSVLGDTFEMFPIWMASENPRQFVITSDYDFSAALNRPWDVGVRYILVSNPIYGAAPDAINTRYPTIWATGAGVGTLAYVATSTVRGLRWRLYEVIKPPEAKKRP